MRVTTEVMVTRSLDRLSTRLQQYERKQNELSTGKRILAASDDPAGARRASSLRAAMQAREQELRNSNDAIGWLDSADTQLQAATNRLNRVQDLALQGASQSSDEQRRALAAEIREITGEIAGIANATHLGRPMFGGFTGGNAVEKVDGVWTTSGWTETDGGDQVMRRITDTEQVRVNVTAGEWLGFGSPDGDLLTQLDRLVANLEAGNADQISASIGGLQRSRASVTDALGAIGAATNRVTSSVSRTQDLMLTLRNELSQLEDVDLAQGVMELQVQQVAYEATLQALGRALPPSLVAFLR